MTAVGEAQSAPGKLSLLPPHHVLPAFLSAAEVAGLLAYAADREAAFTATQVGRNDRGRVDPAVRVSTSIRDLGAFRPLLRDRLRAMAEELRTTLRLSAFTTTRVELELVAHGDGAFYARHIDTSADTDRDHVRVLSGVYYFHREPKGFTGGALRLHAIGDVERFVDIEPINNALLVFPAWAPHEVRPVSCPSGQFMDSRFAINCWLYARRLGAASGAVEARAGA